jgi:hypothetical protein
MYIAELTGTSVRDEDVYVPGPVSSSWRYISYESCTKNKGNMLEHAHR